MLTTKDENNIGIFERQILRNILVLLILTIYGEYEITWRLKN
jgi:hypothetical protein